MPKILMDEFECQCSLFSVTQKLFNLTSLNLTELWNLNLNLKSTKNLSKNMYKILLDKNSVQKKMYKNTEDKITRSRLIILFEKSDF